MVDNENKLEDLASGHHDQSNLRAHAIPGPVRKFRGPVLEHVPLVHELQMIVRYAIKIFLFFDGGCSQIALHLK